MLDRFNNEPKRYYSLNKFYREKFKQKVFKISLDGNFTCPNLDGTVGNDGCIYCLNSRQNQIIKRSEEHTS